MDEEVRDVAWQPQPGPQEALVHCPLTDILVGGARGGGKTDGILGKYAIKGERYGKKFNAVFFRQEMPQADDLIERAKEIYLPIGSQWYEQKKFFILPGGGRIRFRPLENVSDAAKYQGQNLSDAAVEEAGNYPSSDAIDRLFGCLRSKVPVQLLLTANPGGAGHHWIKDRYIDPAPGGLKVLERKLPNGAIHKYTFIPSWFKDNKILQKDDPGYADRLYLTGSEALVKAWLNGDWSIISGAVFSEFNPLLHQIKRCKIPDHWARYRSFDWGYAKPFAVHWWAVADGDNSLMMSDGQEKYIPRGALVCYREWYGMVPGKPNVGIRMQNVDIAAGIKARTPKEENISLTVTDKRPFQGDGGIKISEEFGVNGVPLHVGHVDRIQGWAQIHTRLHGVKHRLEKVPMIYFTEDCTHIIRTLPALQPDPHRAEDVDDDLEDHAPDSVRYACMERPIIRRAPKPENMRGTGKGMTFKELIRHDRAKRSGF